MPAKALVQTQLYQQISPFGNIAYFVQGIGISYTTCKQTLAGIMSPLYWQTLFSIDHAKDSGFSPLFSGDV